MSAPLCFDHAPPRTKAGTLVCLTGVNSGAYLMEGAVRELGETWRVVRFSSPGVDGMPVKVPFSVRDYARQVADTLAEMAIKDAVVLGHSLGGYAAQELARLAPERVSRLVLVSTSRGQPDTALDVAQMSRKTGVGFWEMQKLNVRDVAAAQAMLFGPGFAAREADVFNTFLRERAEHMPSEAVSLAHIAAGAGFSSAGWVHQLEMPALVVHGGADVLVSAESGRKLAKALPHANWLELFGVGHFPMLEYADFWRRVGEFGGGAVLGEVIEKPQAWWRRMWERWQVHG